jgi:hypothetical protein
VTGDDLTHHPSLIAAANVAPIACGSYAIRTPHSLSLGRVAGKKICWWISSEFNQQSANFQLTAMRMLKGISRFIFPQC